MNCFRAVAALVAAITLLPAAQPQKGPIYVIAHRGDHVHHAENSIAAIESAAAAGADYAELDVRTTKDGKLVLMHDKTVDRTTDGHGAVKEMTAEEIAHLTFKDYGGSVPTFDEALNAAKGKIQIYLDWKDAKPEAIFDFGTGCLYVSGGSGALYRLDSEHRLETMVSGVTVSNGLGWSITTKWPCEPGCRIWLRRFPWPWRRPSAGLGWPICWKNWAIPSIWAIRR